MTTNAECNTPELIAERHERELYAFKALTGPEQVRHQIRERDRYSRDPWAFLQDCTFTLNQVSRTDAIAPFPSYLQYIEFLARLWQRESLIACAKSRRMVCSWSFISLYLHDTIFNTGRFNGFVSKKEDDSADLVGRAEFIVKHIPEWRIPKALLPAIENDRMSKQPPLLNFPEIHSKIQGMPSGADQLRQFTLSGIMGDEAAFWPDAEQFYSASKPTLDGGGRMTLISSRSPGFFKKIVFDQLDSPDLSFREVAPVEVKKPLEGVEVWKNPKNRFVVVDLHYTADPSKRGVAWRDAIKNSMTARSFSMEYDKSWQTHDGKSVFPDFNKTIHVSNGPMKIEPGVPLILSFDFGLTPACLVGQLVGRQLRVIKEFQELDGSISKLAPVVWNYLTINYPMWVSQPDMIYTYVDPAGFQRAQTDARTCVDILREYEFKSVRPGPINWTQRKKSVEDYLIKTYAEGAALIISDSECPILIEAMSGGYRYPERALEVEPENLRPIKDKFSHLADCMQYLASGTLALKKSYGINIATPSYNFGNSTADDQSRLRREGYGT